MIYDRKHSAIATAEADDFDWEAIFRDAQWFHFTGITPALSENLAEICLQACKIAKANGIVVSCDLNYRSKLWTKEKANATMSKLAPYVEPGEYELSPWVKAIESEYTTKVVNEN